MKYVYRSDDRNALNDLEVDPFETRNLFADPVYESDRQELRQRLSIAQNRLDDPFRNQLAGE